MKPYIFYPDPCGRGLKPFLSAVSVSGFTGFVWPIAVSKIPGSSGSSLRFFPAVATFFFMKSTVIPQYWGQLNSQQFQKMNFVKFTSFSGKTMADGITINPDEISNFIHFSSFSFPLRVS